MTKIDIEMKKRENLKSNFKLDKVLEILESFKNQQEYMKEDDGSVKEIWELEYQGLDELKDVISNIANKL